MADFSSFAGNTARFAFAPKFERRESGSTAAAETKLFVPMVFSLEIPGGGTQPESLILYVTPSEITIDRRKVLAEHYLKSGPIREEWGNELDVWNCSGWIAAFYKNLGPNVSPVLTQIDRDDTAGYRNFLSLLSFYKNNGRSYYDRAESTEFEERNLVFPTEFAYVNVTENGQQDRRKIKAKMGKDGSESPAEYRNRVRKTVASSSTYQNLAIRSKTTILRKPSQTIKHVGSVRIAYDMRMLKGHFESFEWTESVDHPYQIRYAFSFIVKAQYDLAAEWTGQGTVRG